MKALIQRVTQASVTINSQISGQIEQGLLVFLGIEKNDSQQTAQRLVQKILAYRVFADSNGKMNLDVQAINGGLLIVSQFTLVADTHKGTRPGFSKGASPQASEKLYRYFIDETKKSYPKIATGEFGADMQVELINDGPVTFLLEA